MSKIRYSKLLVLIALCSCVTVKPTQTHFALYSWTNSHLDDLIIQVGEPVYTFSDGKSGRALVYYNFDTQKQENPIKKLTENEVEVITDKIWLHLNNRAVPNNIIRDADVLYVNSEGFIYSVQSNQNDRVVREDVESQVIVNSIIVVILTIGIILLAS